MKKGITVFFIGLVLSFTVAAQASSEPTQLFPIGEGGVFRIAELDTNSDGNIDCRVAYDKKGRKVWEAQDFNKDGVMDDFYYFEEGLLVRQEVDSNHDGKIDLWCVIERGLYLVSYEQDTNHDGVADKKKYFDS